MTKPSMTREYDVLIRDEDSGLCKPFSGFCFGVMPDHEWRYAGQTNALGWFGYSQTCDVWTVGAWSVLLPTVEGEK